MRLLVGAVVVVWSSSLAAQPLQVPAPEIGDPAAAVAAPVVPSFELPPSEPGFVTVQELRVHGRRHLGTQVKVKGYVTWIYDCVAAVRQPGESRRRTQKRIDDDPTQCERPKFYLGMSLKESPLDGLWVVDVPRPPNKLERERLPKEDLRAWPKVPRVKLGAYVTVTGTFAVRSPHAEANSDGLVVFEAIAPAKPTRARPAPAAPPAARPAVPAPVRSSAAPPQPRDRAASIRLSNEGSRAYAARRFGDAIARYKESIAQWSGNHVAWYGLGGAYLGMKHWTYARDAFARTVELAPDQAMYHLVYGLALYEAAIAAAREAEAKKQNRRPEDVIIDPSAIRHDKALVHLTHAVKLEPRIWRAHYYIGRIHRDAGDARWAAESFDTAVRARPSDPNPWIALVELYRRWRYTDQAIVVANHGTAAAPSPDMFYVLGMSYDDKGKWKEAIDAFDKALGLDANHAKALFQRGQAHHRRRDRVKAKADLEAFLALASSANHPFARQQAQRMLMDMLARR